LNDVETIRSGRKKDGATRRHNTRIVFLDHQYIGDVVPLAL
jgi:hypothetical protein